MREWKRREATGKEGSSLPSDRASRSAGSVERVGASRDGRPARASFHDVYLGISGAWRGVTMVGGPGYGRMKP